MRAIAILVLAACGGAASSGPTVAQVAPPNPQPNPNPQPIPIPIPPPVPNPIPNPNPNPNPIPQPIPNPQPVATTFTFAAVGDVMLGSTFPDETGKNLPPEDGKHILEELTPVLSAADITFGNLEGPMIDGGVSTKCGSSSTGLRSASPPARQSLTGPPTSSVHRKHPRKAQPAKSCYAFRVPTRYGQYLKDAGFDVMGLANNHAMDFGEDGRQSSLRTLDALGIAHSGPVGDIAHLEVRGVHVALVAFATYATSYDLNDLAAAQTVVAGEVSRNDVVIVSFHGGAEGATKTHVTVGPETFYNENRGDLRVFTHAMIDAGAALVFGHGPHVVRGMELYKGRLIAYSLGNFATYGGMNLLGPTGIACVLQVTLAKDGALVAANVVPTLQNMPGGPHLDPERRVIPLLRQLSSEDFGAAAPQISDEGVLAIRAK